MSDQERFNEWLKQEAKSYNRPPHTPREILWSEIEHARRTKALAASQTRPRTWLRIGSFAAAAAVVLAVGFGIGRFVSQQNDVPRDGRVAVTPPVDHEMPRKLVGIPLAYQMEAASHFSQAEILLTEFNSSTAQAASEAEFGRWARRLLADTHLLLQSPAAENLEYKTMLEDLELVLQQIVQATRQEDKEEKSWIANSMKENGLMERLRLLQPLKPAFAGT